MTRKVFYSFHYKPDNWRASQVRNAGVVEGNQPVSDNAWETIKAGGAKVIEAWIDTQLVGRSCTVVLIGSDTAGRKWINYEIVKTWNDGKGLVGIYVHNLKDAAQRQSSRGRNPFEEVNLNSGKTKLSSVVKAYDPPYSISTSVYEHIKNNVDRWVEEAIKIRQDHG
jgi:antiphage defense system Thoeris ThsB-like protein